MNLEIENYWDFLWIFNLLFISFLWGKLILWRKKTRLIFADKKFHERFFPSKKSFQKLFAIMYCLAFICLILAIVGIHRKERKGSIAIDKASNIIFLMDISNSMNAEDIAEKSRLEQAKNIVSQTLKQLNNDRVGVVAFAGEAQSLMPLTDNYSAVDILVNELETGIIKQQGTDFWVAIKQSSQRMSHIPIGTKKIILISDGENNEGNHQEAIKEAQKHETSIISVGIGTENGAPIPEKKLDIYSGYKKDNNGQTIITKRETEILKLIAEQTNGIYIDGNNTQNTVRKIVNEIKNTQKLNTDKKIKIFYTEHFYQYFLGLAILLFALIWLLNPKKDFNF